MQVPERFRTERLALRRPQIDDAQAIFDEYAHDPEVARYMPWRHHASPDDTREFLATCPAAWESGREYAWAITPVDEDRAIGMLGCRIQAPKADLGYVLGKRFWGRGLMAEAVRAVSDWLLAQPSIYRVWAICDVENRRSARVLEKAGMQLEGTLRRWGVHPNRSSEPRDALCYARVREGG